MTLELLENVLDEHVRPALALDGGNIAIDHLKENILYVRMLGQCSGCPSAAITMEETVKAELLEAVPELEDVVLVTGVSDELIADMKQILKMRHRQ